MPGEDKGRTTHETEMTDLSGDNSSVTIKFDRGDGVLFLWYVEIIVKP